MDQNTILHLASALLIVLLVISGSKNFGVFFLGILTISLLAAIVILLLAFADYLVFPILTRILFINIIPFKNYAIPKEQDL